MTTSTITVSPERIQYLCGRKGQPVPSGLKRMTQKQLDAEAERLGRLADNSGVSAEEIANAIAHSASATPADFGRFSR